MRKAKLLKPPRKSDVEATINACLANASRLMDERRSRPPAEAPKSHGWHDAQRRNRRKPH